MKSRIIMSGQNVIHRNCHKSYTNLRNVAKAAGMSSSVDDVLDSDNDFSEELSKTLIEVEGVHVSPFDFSKLCFICNKSYCTKRGNLDKICKVEKESNISEDVLRACNHRNDMLSNEVVNSDCIR